MFSFIIRFGSVRTSTLDKPAPKNLITYIYLGIYAFKSSKDPSNLVVDPLGPCKPNPCPHGTLNAHALAPWDPEGLSFQRATLKKALVSKYNYILASAAPGTICLSLR